MWLQRPLANRKKVQGFTQEEQGAFIINIFTMVVFTITMIHHVSSVGGSLLLRLRIVQETKMAHIPIARILKSAAHCIHTQLPLSESSE